MTFFRALAILFLLFPLGISAEATSLVRYEPASEVTTADLDNQSDKTDEASHLFNSETDQKKQGSADSEFGAAGKFLISLMIAQREIDSTNDQTKIQATKNRLIIDLNEKLSDRLHDKLIPAIEAGNFFRYRGVVDAYAKEGETKFYAYLPNDALDCDINIELFVYYENTAQGTLFTDVEALEGECVKRDHKIYYHLEQIQEVIDPETGAVTIQKESVYGPTQSLAATTDAQETFERRYPGNRYELVEEYD